MRMEKKRKKRDWEREKKTEREKEKGGEEEKGWLYFSIPEHQINPPGITLKALKEGSNDRIGKTNQRESLPSSFSLSLSL